MSTPPTPPTTSDPPATSASATTLSLYRAASTASSATVTGLLNHCVRRLGADFAVLGVLDPLRGTFQRLEVSDACPLPARTLSLIAGYANLRRDPMLLSDTATEPTLAGDPVLGARGVTRRLGAAPVLGLDGQRLGVLVVGGAEPRPWAPDPEARQRALDELVGLAAIASPILSLDEAVAGLRRRHDEHLHRIEKLEGLERATANLAILTTDLGGVIRSMNEGAERLLRYPAASLVGQTTPDIFSTVQGATMATIAELETRPAIERPCDWIRGDGTMVPVHTVVSAATDEVGTQTGYVVVARDITDERRLEHMQEAFVATVSHELRTPLTSMLGALKLVVGGVAGDLPSRARRLLDMAVTNGEQLALLVDDILDTAKLAAGPPLNRVPCDVAELVRSAVEANQPQALSLDVEVRAACDDGDATVPGDCERLTQVLNNLLSNAMKFSPAGTQVVARVVGSAEGVEITVSDRGPGIPEADRARVFERFTQLDHRPRGRQRGTGLGLSIVRTIAEGHGGRVWVDEAPLGGAVFHVRLPREARAR